MKEHPLGAKECLNVPATVSHVKNQYVFALDPIDDHILANWKAPKAGAQIIIPTTPHPGMSCKKKEAASNGINQSVGVLDAATFTEDVVSGLQ